MTNMSHFEIKRNSGFTLLELLVVIAIIGVLVSLAVVSYSGAQQKARDAQRQADLKAIQDGLEQYYADNTAYPDGDCDPGHSYLPGGIPSDPKTGTTYSAASCSDSGYCFCVDLEGDNGNSSANNCSSFVSSGGDYFCVQNLQ